jgi:hypothetical protein
MIVLDIAGLPALSPVAAADAPARADAPPSAGGVVLAVAGVDFFVAIARLTRT